MKEEIRDSSPPEQEGGGYIATMWQNCGELEQLLSPSGFERRAANSQKSA